MYNKFSTKCKKIFDTEKEDIILDDDNNRLKELFGKRISEEYRYILEKHGGAYIKDDYYIHAVERTPLTDSEGWDSIILFYPVHGEDNIFKQYEMYSKQLPEEYIPIGEMDGGNLVCVRKNAGQIYAWIHDTEDKDIFLIGKNMRKVILSFQKVKKEYNDLSDGLVSVKLSDDFYKLL